MLPDTVAPDLPMELDAITPIKGGTAAGGFELFPGRLIQFPPQLGGTVLVWLAKPLKASGAEPPLSPLIFAHSAPQKVTDWPIPVSISPTTKEPVPVNARVLVKVQVMVVLAAAGGAVTIP